MTFVCDRNICTGCGACRQACPRQCISMQPDCEGFLRPQIDMDQCVGCQKCRRICPALCSIRKDDFRQEAYAVQNKDSAVLSHSSSGGVAGTVTRRTLQDGGTVYGCIFDNCMVARHQRLTDISETGRLFGSKYVQSDIGDSYSQVKSDLNTGRSVTFFGTPCQVAGLYGYLENTNTSSLLTVELICHGVPSPALFAAYLRWKEDKLKEPITDFSFRGKSRYGWNTAYILKTKTKTKEQLSTLDPYYHDFMEAVNYRECCYQCAYASPDRLADLTIGDYWGIRQAHPEWEEKMHKGVSALLVNTQRGKAFWDTIQDEFDWQESAFDKVSARNGNLKHPSARPLERDTYYQLLIETARFDGYARRFYHSPAYFRAKLKSLIPQQLKETVKKFIRR